MGNQNPHQAKPKQRPLIAAGASISLASRVLPVRPLEVGTIQPKTPTGDLPN